VLHDFPPAPQEPEVFIKPSKRRNSPLLGGSLMVWFTTPQPITPRSNATFIPNHWQTTL